MRRGKKSPSPAQPHRKTKIRRRQPLSPSLLQPRDPCRPPEAAQFSESPQKRSQWSCAPAAKQKETCKTDSVKQRTEKKKGCSRTAFFPIPSRPSGEGRKSPNKATSTVPKGPIPHPRPSWGNPTLDWGQSFTRELRGPACKNEGCRSRGCPPSDPIPSPPTPLSPLASSPSCSGLGIAGWPPHSPAPPLG